MSREAWKVRFLRALSGKSQEQVAQDVGVHRSLIGHFEQGRAAPSREQLERMAKADGITLGEAEQLRALYEGFRGTRVSRVRQAEDLLERLSRSVRAHAEAVYHRILRLPLPPAEPRPEDRERAEVLWSRLKGFPAEIRLEIVRAAKDFQSWALCERVCAESVVEASRQVAQAVGLARLAEEIAERAPGPEEWRNRLRGYAGAHAANALRVQGDLKASEAMFDRAREQWHRGSDPAALLDPGRLPDLEASLRRGQRRFGEALALLDEAFAIGRSQARVLVNKGFTLEVMGEYERSIQTLLQARPLVDGQGDLRLQNMLHCNLGFTLCHVGRFTEAAELAEGVRRRAADMGDQIGVLRGIWLQGRIAAGQGRTGEARSFLAQARREFAARGMSYDVALALLEEAALLLADGRMMEVKGLAGELAVAFDSKGVHREVLAALRLFQQAAEMEEATAELARRVLRFLYLARHDQGLRFES